MTRKARRGSNERCGEREKIGHPYFVLFCFVMSALSPYLFLSIYLTFFFLKRTHRREGKRGKIHTAALSFAYRDAPRDPRCWGRCKTRGRGIAFRLLGVVDALNLCLLISILMRIGMPTFVCTYFWH